MFHMFFLSSLPKLKIYDIVLKEEGRGRGGGGVVFITSDSFHSHILNSHVFVGL